MNFELIWSNLKESNHLSFFSIAHYCKTARISKHPLAFHFTFPFIPHQLYNFPQSLLDRTMLIGWGKLTASGGSRPEGFTLPLGFRKKVVNETPIARMRSNTAIATSSPSSRGSPAGPHISSLSLPKTAKKIHVCYDLLIVILDNIPRTYLFHWHPIQIRSQLASY